VSHIKPGSNLASTSMTSRVIAATLIIFVSGCGSVLKRDPPGKNASASGVVSSVKKRGGYYLDDGPGDNPPVDLASVPDATPRDEPLRQANMRPYSALGKWYTPKTALEAYRERGIASWYGRRYHGQKTASGELYDMYGMTAAHPTLPIPSYARVTNISNRRSVVVRVNDRGPFLSERLIDLSYTAAYKLDVLGGGSAWVEVETILPDGGAMLAITAAPTPVSNFDSSSSSMADRSASRIAVAVGETRSPTPPHPEEQQSDDANPGLFQITASQAPYSTYDDSSTDANTSGPSNTPDKGGIYLQLGAFSAYDNADNFLARLRATLPSISPLVIMAKDGLFKVHAGPYPNQNVAREDAHKIAQSLSIRPMLLTR
jgi:rare lipoprotein A